MTGDMGGNGLIDDVIVIGWTDSDFKISRALLSACFTCSGVVWRLLTFKKRATGYSQSAPIVDGIFVLFEPAHNKTYSKTCVTSKDSDQPVHSPSIARVLVYPSLDGVDAIEGTCDQRILIRL